MPTPKERLSHLLELAAQGPAERAHLAGEVADLLLDWPAQYPAAMRETFEALLEKIMREVGGDERAQLAARFEGRADFPLSLLNEFFLVAPPSMQDEILARNDEAAEIGGMPVDSETLLGAARANPKDFAPLLAHIAGIDETLAAQLLRDPRALAAIAKATGINRATFSAIAILAAPVRSVEENFAMLALFDAVPVNGARHLLAFWRTHHPAREFAEAAA